MKFNEPATSNPIDQLKVVGQPIDRVDGPLKTTGTAPYAYEQHKAAPNAAYGYVVGSSIAKGRITKIDTAAAKAAPGPEIEEIGRKSQAITKLALDLYANGRRLVRRLRPEVLDMLGLHGAVEEMLRHYDSGSGCRFAFHSEGDFSRIGNELAISAYRIVQEALSNVMKHAQASNAEVTLVLDDEHEVLRIAVEDDGQGFDPAVSSEGIGIIGMRERVYALRGTMAVRSAPQRGTTVEITLPLTSPTPVS